MSKYNFKDIKRWFWGNLFFLSLGKLRKNCYGSYGACGNRAIHRMELGKIEISVTIKDTLKPAGYSREELYEMLTAIRQYELLSGWKVPEPTFEIESI